MNTFAPMQLRKLKVLISWFFLAVLALGMADFSLHALTHKHGQAHELHHDACSSDIEIQTGASIIFGAEQECFLCGQFVIHTAWAVADLVSVHEFDYSELPAVFSCYQLISSKLSAVFLRGPPEA